MKTLRHSLVALVLLSAAGCGPMAYDSYVAPSGGVVVSSGPPSAHPPVVVSPPAPTCVLVSGYSAPATQVELFTNPWCSGQPEATLDTDVDGRFEASLCFEPGAPMEVHARAIDAYGQTSSCSSAIEVQPL